MLPMRIFPLREIACWLAGWLSEASRFINIIYEAWDQHSDLDSDLRLQQLGC